MKTAIHWFRCDLRLTDNAALSAALGAAERVIPVFIFDPSILKSPDTGAPIVGFMLECLRSLEHDIAACGGRLIFRHGEVAEEMLALWRETKAEALYFNRDYEPQARTRDAAIEKLAQAHGLEVHSFKDGVLHEPDEIVKGDGTPYKVFGAYRRVWEKLPKNGPLPKAAFKAARGGGKINGIALPTAKSLGFQMEIALPEAGEKAAQERLRKFVSGDLLNYAEQRNLPALGATSRLSPHIRIGTISPRQIYASVTKAAGDNPKLDKDASTFLSELVWREFYRQILWHFPRVEQSAFKEKYDHLKWTESPNLFRAWCEGRTGFPLVDAGMRQLNSIGWMHNRLRMIVGAFLTKDLLISYQQGERYFMQKLLDADLAQNNGGWQWVASTGTDSQPYFRIFNPASQAKKFDPEGRFIRQYVPEIDSKDYPAPIVDHAEQRAKALALFRNV